MTPLSRLTCEEVFRRLDDYLDRELGPQDAQRVKAHLDTCEVCSREYVFEQSVLDGVRGKLRRIALPPDLLTRVLTAIQRAKSADGDDGEREGPG